MKDIPAKFAWFALAAATIVALGAWFANGYFQQLLFSLFGTVAGLSAGLFAVNVYLDRSSRKIAAAPLALLIETAVNRIHNDFFITIGHSKFGSAKFNKMIDDFIDGDREPRVFSPEDRKAISSMIVEHGEQMRLAVVDLDQRFSTLISVLGWSFDAKVVATALESKRNASELIAAMDSADPDTEERLIRHWFDLDLSANLTRRFLADILEIDPSNL